MLASYSSEMDVRGLRLTLRHWRTHGAGADAPTLVMLHGWMDVSASFQFLVDALEGAWNVVAPDWRGFGASEQVSGKAGIASYWIPDYYADLETLLDRLGLERAHLIGHSMGGNVAAVYAAARPERVATLTMLDAFGLAPTDPDDAPARLARWLDEVRTPPRLHAYASLAAVADRLQKNNPRLTRERAEWLAPHWAGAGNDGRWHLKADPAHRVVYPLLYRLDEVMACWRAVSAPVLWLQARESDVRLRNGRFDSESYRRRADHFRDVRVHLVDDAGHMVHHDQPRRLAELIEPFIEQVAGSTR